MEFVIGIVQQGIESPGFAVAKGEQQDKQDQRAGSHSKELLLALFDG